MENNACKTNNVHQLLTEKWSENRAAYRVLTKITEQRERRIKSIIDQGRYSNKCVD